MMMRDPSRLAQLAFHPIGMGLPIDRDVAAFAVAAGDDSPPPAGRLRAPGLAPDIIRGRGLASTPMIENAREMMDAVRQLGDAEKKIVILRAIKLRTGIARLLHDLPAERGEVAEIIVGEQKVRRPIGLELGRGQTFLGDLVFVGKDEIGLRIALQVLHDLEERVRFEEIVVIEKADPIAPCACSSPELEAAEMPPVLSRLHKHNSRVATARWRPAARAFPPGSSRRQSESVPSFRRPD